MKQMFWTADEHVKYYYFLAPASQTFTATFTIESLTEDFYPSLFFYRNNLTAVPTDFRTLKYPTLISYTNVLGFNFPDLLNQK